jgi:chromosome segregation ATPase
MDIRMNMNELDAKLDAIKEAHEKLNAKLDAIKEAHEKLNAKLEAKLDAKFDAIAKILQDYSKCIPQGGFGYNVY